MTIITTEIQKWKRNKIVWCMGHEAYVRPMCLK